MKIKIPKYAYSNGKGKKSKYHLRSNIYEGSTVCGQNYGEDINILFKNNKIKIKDLSSEKRCFKCFSAFILDEEYYKNCLKEYFDIDMIIKNKTDIYKCVKR